VAGLNDPAQVVRLRGTSVEVSRFGLGTAFIGTAAAPAEQDRAIAAVTAALRSGVRYYDTAPLYGLGHAERLLGRALAGQPREAFTVLTKVGRPVRPGPDGQPASVFDFSEAAALRSLEESLGRLGLDRADIVLVHDPDDYYDEAMSGAYPALRKLRSDGVVGAIGAGVNHAWLAAKVVRDANPDCVLVAGRYTLLDQRALDELLPLCAKRGVAVLIGGVFNSGILASPVDGACFDYAPASQKMLERARRIEEVCSRHRVPLKAAALQFPLGHPAVSSVVSGCRSPAEVEENLRMLRLEIPAGLWDDLRAEGFLHAEAPTPDRRAAGI
jgi:D-threo-aldose 1-dehydrogenase